MSVWERSHELASERFTKVDFHIHTPESQCYGDRLVAPEQMVDAALAAGLEAIAITDHNTFQGVDVIRRLGSNGRLAVFPGVELSTQSGHVLALFDREALISHLDGFLDSVGVVPTGKGDGVVPVRDRIEDVLRKVVEWGGIAVAAHIERWPTGFLQTNERAKVKARIHGSQYLTALEITQPQNKGLWNRGEMKGYPKEYACIQGSDAHALEDIGRRPTYVMIPSMDLKGLRLAFDDHEMRIRFPEEMVGPS